jgi:malate-CoA ligase subunit alpha
MSILIDEKTPILIQGITGDKGTFHAQEMMAYGSNVVAGVTPGKGGKTHLGVPVFNTVKEAVEATGATTSITFVAPPFAADAIMEGADAGLSLICSITDGIPAQDMMRVKRYLRRYPKERRTMVVGPNCAGIISPGKSMLGIMPGHIYLQGNVGVISRSGTLGYEAAAQMKAEGIGITTSVGIGGDPINGSSFLDHLALFEQDPDTKAVLMIGEIGGPQEAEASAWIKELTSFSKRARSLASVCSGVWGLRGRVKRITSAFPSSFRMFSTSKGRRMGHAGAIISATGDSAAEKAEIMRSYGLTVAPSPGEFGTTVAQVMRKLAA